MALGPEDLVLCAGTLPHTGLRERAAAAAAAGFRGLSLFVADHARARAEGLSDADLRTLLADHGLELAELDPLLSWVPEAALGASASGEGRAFFEHGEESFYAIADALGARSLNAVLYADAPLPIARIADAFAGLCERAARHDLLVHLEFLPWTQICDASVALDVVAQAGQPNGGILVDSWHHFRGGGDAAALPAEAGERVLALQLSDAPARAEANPVEETLHRRLLPGRGDADLVGLVRRLDALGCRAPVGVEVFSDALAAVPAKDAARRAAEAARAVLAQARVSHARPQP